ncbi:MAG: glycosyltransferase family 39 protein [bacterium]
MHDKILKIRQIGLLDLIAAVIIAIAIRLIVARFETEVGVDSVHYILMGDNIAHGHSWDTWDPTGGRWTLPPLFPILIAIFRLLGAGLELSGHLASITAGTLLIIAVYNLTRRLYGLSVARIAAWLAVFTPILVDYSVVILTELLYATCAIFMLISIHRAFSKEGTLTDTFISGIWAALAYFTKAFGIILVPFLLLSYLFAKGGNSGNKPLRQAIFALLGFLLLSVPYWVALHQYSGQWVIDGKGIGQQVRMYARNLDEEHIDPRYSGELTKDGQDFAINVNPMGKKPEWATPKVVMVNFVKKYIQKLVRIYQDFPFTPTYPNNVLLLYLFPAILLGLGIFTGPGRWIERDSDKLLFYWWCPLVFGLPIIFVEVRYFVPIVPLMIPFMAKGVEKVGDWIIRRFYGEEKRDSVTVKNLAINLVIVVFIILALPKITYKITHWDDPMIFYNPRRIAAEWLVDFNFERDRIMEYGHSVSFYSGVQSILIPDGDLDDVIRIARKYGTDILSLDEFYVLRAHRRPKIEYLFDLSKKTPPELVLIYSDTRYPGLHHFIYCIRTEQEIAETKAVNENR